MSKRKYTEEQLINAINSSTSYRQVLEKLGLNSKGGGGYISLKNKIIELNLDTSHFKGQAWNNGKKLGHKRDLNDYLSNKITIQSHQLKMRLLSEKVFDHKCYSCNLTSWLDCPIPLELDHINGNHDDNSLYNLRLLCPNCHALTPTHAGKNKKKT